MLTFKEIVKLLKTQNNNEINQLLQMADETRKKFVGDEVHLRGLIEISNYCVRKCAYCGINCENQSAVRYRMKREEIIHAAHFAKKLGYGTIVMQSGEDYGIKSKWMAELIAQIKSKDDLAITLSLGERTNEELALWKKSGANRYLLRFETSDRQLYDSIHPSRKGSISDRIAILMTLRELGYEIGSGIMIGIPGQTYEMVAKDITIFHDMDLDMIGVGPYIPHPQTRLGKSFDTKIYNIKEQVPNNETMTLKVLALTRIACPQSNIPSTTALETIDKDKGRQNGLLCGANVVMPNITPLNYRKLYEIYPDKAGSLSTPEESDRKLKELISSIGRKLGKGYGNRQH